MSENVGMVTRCGGRPSPAAPENTNHPVWWWYDRKSGP